MILVSWIPQPGLEWHPNHIRSLSAIQHVAARKRMVTEMKLARYASLLLNIAQSCPDAVNRDTRRSVPGFDFDSGDREVALCI